MAKRKRERTVDFPATYGGTGYSFVTSDGARVTYTETGSVFRDGYRPEVTPAEPEAEREAERTEGGPSE